VTGISHIENVDRISSPPSLKLPDLLQKGVNGNPQTRRKTT